MKLNKSEAIHTFHAEKYGEDEIILVERNQVRCQPLRGKFETLAIVLTRDEIVRLYENLDKILGGKP